MSRLDVEWIAYEVVGALYYEKSPSRTLQKPLLRPALASLALVSRSLHDAVRSVTMRYARHAFHLSVERDAIEHTAQTGCVLRDPGIARYYRSLTLVLSGGGNHSPQSAALALVSAGRLLVLCTNLHHLTIFFGKGYEVLTNDDIAERFAASILPASEHLRSLSICLDNAEGPGHFHLVGQIAAVGLLKPPQMQSVTLRGWIDPATLAFEDDAYTIPWLQQISPVPRTAVTTRMTFKDCQMTYAAFRALLLHFQPCLSHLLLSWSRTASHASASFSSHELFVALLDTHLEYLTVRDLRDQSPFFTHVAAKDPHLHKTGPVFLLSRQTCEPSYANMTIRTLAIELVASNFHVNFLSRFAIPSLEEFHLTGNGAGDVKPIGLLSTRTALQFMRQLGEPAFDSLRRLVLEGFPWATQAYGVLRSACDERKVEVDVRE